MKVYVIDDDRSIRTSLKEILEDEDFVVEQFATGKSAVKALEKERPALILLDLWLGKEDGLEVLDEIRRMYPALPVLMISGHGTIEQAVAATKKGAVDFLEKPLSIQSILDKIHAVLHVEPNVVKKKEVQLDFDEIIGDSEQILRVKQAIAQAARTNARVFIFGENGTGKELVARAIFRNSSRSDKPFVDLNCAAIPAELIESELFGHEKGAFTGAADRRIGKFEQADEGTLFLDEICDMAMTMQAKVLRVLEEQRFQRVGGNESISVDVRVIAATNIDPQQAIRDGRFREDLYYRLNVIPINMPALRERMGDIPLLLDHFLRQAVKANGLPAKVFTPGAIDLLARYEWPGNVRELKNVVERLAILSEGEQIDVNQVADSLFRPDQDDQFPGLDLRSARRDFEKKYIMQALKQFEKNISRTARFLGMERTHLHRKLKTLKINLDEL